jgi:SAM-dependent methyltransferase
MMMWNRLRYTVWAPAYDALVRAAGFDAARRLSIDRLRLAPGDRVLIVGAGTGLDLDFLPANVHVTAIDVTPAMLKHLERRAAGTGRSVTTRIMDARQLAFPDSSFDAVVMHLILAVMPQPERGLSEAVRVVKPGGRIAVFDKFFARVESEEHEVGRSCPRQHSAGDPLCRWRDEISQRQQFARRKGAAIVFYGPTFRVRSMRPKYLSSPMFRANPPALTAAAGHTTESSPPSQAFMVAVSNQS